MEANRKTILQRTTAKKIQAFLEGEARKALLVTGARQVGKTTLIRQLGQEAFPNFVELNFLENTAARQLFETATDSSDFLLRLSALVGEKLVPGKTLIFLDEVQECKEIVTAIKFLVEEGSYRYILSGSLLGVELKDIRSAPVGYLDVLEMFPMRCITSTAKSRGNWTLSLSTRAMCCPLRSRAARTTRGTMPCLA